jgi:hypothetical protein
VLNFQIQRPTSWQEIATRIQKEKDPEKIVQLSNELITAIDLQTGNPGKKQPRAVRLNGKARL